MMPCLRLPLQESYQTHPRRNDYSDRFYDVFEDWDLIESSFLMQYGIRLREEDDMSWQEFSSLLSGIMPKTPLGNVVSIRAENDSKILDNFTPEQMRIRNEWLSRHGNGIQSVTMMQGVVKDICR